MSDTEIRDAAHLRVVPDGTIISWLRIPHDPTSEAVAFVRREIDPDTRQPVVWISPGGWEPQTILSAGVNFPCKVVRWGQFNVDSMLATELPAVVETLDSGGQYSRIAALDAAVQLFRGDALYVLPRNGEGPNLQPVLDTAKVFEDHLLRDDLADALNATIDCGLIGEDQARRAYAAWERGDTDPSPTDIVRGEDQ